MEEWYRGIGTSRHHKKQLEESARQKRLADYRHEARMDTLASVGWGIVLGAGALVVLLGSAYLVSALVASFLRAPK